LNHNVKYSTKEAHVGLFYVLFCCFWNWVLLLCSQAALKLTIHLPASASNTGMCHLLHLACGQFLQMWCEKNDLEPCMPSSLSASVPPCSCLYVYAEFPIKSFFVQWEALLWKLLTLLLLHVINFVLSILSPVIFIGFALTRAQTLYKGLCFYSTQPWKSYPEQPDEENKLRK
jgi:hypothetical protein